MEVLAGRATDVRHGVVERHLVSEQVDGGLADLFVVRGVLMPNGRADDEPLLAQLAYERVVLLVE